MHIHAYTKTTSSKEPAQQSQSCQHVWSQFRQDFGHQFVNNLVKLNRPFDAEAVHRDLF